jgi:hypothetical protein
LTAEELGITFNEKPAGTFLVILADRESVGTGEYKAVAITPPSV